MRDGTCIRACAPRRVHRWHMHNGMCTKACTSMAYASGRMYQGVCVGASIEGERIEGEDCAKRNNVIRHCFHGAYHKYPI